MAFRDKIREETYESLTGVITSFLRKHAGEANNLLDIGCADGGKTLQWAEALGIPREGIHGVEGFEVYREKAASVLTVAGSDIESDSLPYPDEHFDLVIANQVFEHIKNIFHLMSEACRVTRRGGLLLLSTPNLGSLHNRFLLALGRQPTPIKIFCEHVRGYTTAALCELATASGDFTRAAKIGGGFYPLPPGIGNGLASLWPSGAVYTVQLFRRDKVSDPEYWVRWTGEFRDTQWDSADGASRNSSG